jgi:hypothetical protein
MCGWVPEASSLYTYASVLTFQPELPRITENVWAKYNPKDVPLTLAIPLSTSKIKASNRPIGAWTKEALVTHPSVSMMGSL